MTTNETTKLTLLRRGAENQVCSLTRPILKFLSPLFFAEGFFVVKNMESDVQIKCDFCKREIEKQCEGIKKKRVLLEVEAETGKTGSVVCRRCVNSARVFKRSNVIPELRLARETMAEVLCGNFRSAEYAIKRMQSALSEVGFEIKDLLKALKQRAARMDELNRILDSIQEPYAKWLFDSYPERRKRANYEISKLQIRLVVFHRDGNKCVKCQSERKLSVDHIKPVALGGTDEMENLQTLCKKCNSAKGGK